MEEMKDEYSIVFHDEPPYEVMSTKWLSYEEIIILKHVEEMVEVYHNSGQFDNVLPYILEHFTNPYDFFYELGVFYEENNLFGIGFKREARYTALRDFAKTRLSSLETFDFLLSYDYYLRENAKVRPSWSISEPIDKKSYQTFFINDGNSDFSISDIIKSDNYDSKTASRIIHIEPISLEAFNMLEIKDCMIYGNECGDEGLMYCLYDYEHRNPLSNEARVFYLRQL